MYCGLCTFNFIYSIILNTIRASYRRIHVLLHKHILYNFFLYIIYKKEEHYNNLIINKKKKKTKFFISSFIQDVSKVLYIHI